MAKSLVLSDWLGNYVRHPRELPDLCVNELRRSGWWRALRGRNRGYTFYTKD